MDVFAFGYACYEMLLGWYERKKNCIQIENCLVFINIDTMRLSKLAVTSTQQFIEIGDKTNQKQKTYQKNEWNNKCILCMEELLEFLETNCFFHFGTTWKLVELFCLLIVCVLSVNVRFTAMPVPWQNKNTNLKQFVMLWWTIIDR